MKGHGLAVASGLLLSLALAAPVTGQTVPPPPPGFDSHRPLDHDDYLRKNERGYVTGLPLANYDPNTGFGFGARAYYFFNGQRLLHQLQPHLLSPRSPRSRVRRWSCDSGGFPPRRWCGCRGG